MPTVDPQHIVLATLAGSLVLFVTDALRYDLVALLVVLVLAATRCLTAEEAFAGFSSHAVILIASMYVFGFAVTRWGVAETISQKLLVAGGRGEAGIAMRVTLISALLSSVLSNTGVVAALIPVLSSAARKLRIPASRLMIPLAFGSLVGGLVSVLGTSNNIAINQVIREHGARPFELFEFAHLGLCLIVVVCLYFFGPGRMLLPRTRVSETLSEHYQVPKFVTEVLVEPNSTLINRLVADADTLARYDISVLGIVRPGEEDSVMAPGPYNRIRADDVLIIQGDPDGIVRLREDLGVRERDHVDVGDTRLDSADVLLVEAVVPAGSELIETTLKENDFHASTGINVVAFSHHGSPQTGRVTDQRLGVGDSVLLQGHRRDIQRLRRSRQLLVLDEVETAPIGRGAVVTLVLLALVLILGALHVMPLPVAALAGAVGLVLTRAVKADEALRNIDWSILILTGGMLALGAAFQRHGLGARVAEWIGGMGGLGDTPWMLIGLLLAVTAGLTQVLNHVATAVMMTPVALSLADQLGYDSRPFLMAVLCASSLAFMSPIAHQANAMVMGPGDYKYRDFLRVGTPLTLVLGAVATVLIPLFWPFTSAQ